MSELKRLEKEIGKIAKELGCLFDYADIDNNQHIYKAIEKLKSQWIHIDDEEPVGGTKYLVYDSQSERVGIREYGTHYFHTIDSDGDDGMMSINIVHYMEIPAAPKEK